MTTTFDQAVPAAGTGILDRERIIATAGFNRWLVPPAALCIHLCIGMAYGFSVFWLPLSRAIGSPRPKPAPTCRWRRSCSPRPATGASPAWAGCSRCSSCCSASPPRSGAAGSSASARARPASSQPVCWAGGLVLGAIGVYIHQLWLMWLGAGVIGGVGLGLGYISPVSTLIKWFPDHRGMATGFAIAGFGGGAHDRRAAREPADQLFQDADRCRRLADLPRRWRRSISSS